MDNHWNNRYPAKRLTPSQALLKIQRFCAYQERCHQEVDQKLRTYGLKEEDRGQIIISLIESNFLNEERFALHYARSKWQQLHWGKSRILLELQRRKISPYLQKIAIEQIDPEEYLDKLERWLDKKKNAATGSSQEISHTLFQAALRKGYDSETIKTCLTKVLET